MIYGRQKFHTCFHPIQTPNGVHWSILSRAHATTPNSWSSAYSFRHLFHRKIKLMSTFFMWQTFLVYNLPFSYTFYDLFRLFFFLSHNVTFLSFFCLNTPPSWVFIYFSFRERSESPSLLAAGDQVTLVWVNRYWESSFLGPADERWTPHNVFHWNFVESKNEFTVDWANGQCICLWRNWTKRKLQ